MDNNIHLPSDVAARIRSANTLDSNPTTKEMSLDAIKMASHITDQLSTHHQPLAKSAPLRKLAD